MRSVTSAPQDQGAVAVSGTSKRAVVYLRVSTTKQADKDIDPEGYSLPAQRDACLRKAEELGAEVVDVYMDRGESAKTRDRPKFQEMLSRIQKDRNIDYVILDKVNRFARNRRDDANVLFELRSAGCHLISVKENIDETPAGMLLHGIMATLAEYESRNNGAEAIKGMTKKAEVGGTPGRAPLGYSNVVKMVEGRAVKVVDIDPERAPLVQWAFTEYATGQWTLNTLTEALAANGLRAIPQGNRSPRPVYRSIVGKMLSNRYYLGIVTFRGIEYSGRHEPLVSQELFDRVQEVLRLHGRSGERSRKHPHYLKGTVYCHSCGSRLCLTLARGKYLYFFCAGRHTKLTNCLQRYVQTEEIEVAVGDFYATDVRLDEEDCRSIREGLREVIEARRKGALPNLTTARRQIEDLEHQRRRVARGLVDGSLPTDLAREEQDRIRTELAAAHKLVEAAEVSFGEIETPLLRALELVGRCDEVYATGNTRVRRLCNQAFFHQLRIKDVEVAEGDLVEPWRTFHDPMIRDYFRSVQSGGDREPVRSGKSLNNDFLAPPAGLEPAPPPPEGGALSAELRGHEQATIVVVGRPGAARAQVTSGAIGARRGRGRCARCRILLLHACGSRRRQRAN